jgi:hypothetical protein
LFVIIADAGIAVPSVLMNRTGGISPYGAPSLGGLNDARVDISDDYDCVFIHDDDGL